MGKLLTSATAGLLGTMLAAAPLAMAQDATGQSDTTGGQTTAPMDNGGQGNQGSAAPTAHHPMHGGMHGMMSKTEVEKVQTALNGQGSSIPVDGHMGPKTRMALADFQKSKSLKVTHRLDPATRSALGI